MYINYLQAMSKHLKTKIIEGLKYVGFEFVPLPTGSTEPTPEPLPDDAVVINSTDVLTEDFNSLGGAALDPSTDTKTGIAVASTLPQGWKIERNTTAPRQLGAYADAAEATMYVGGQSLASNAYNGTWNFGATGSDDRAVGGCWSRCVPSFGL